MSADRKILVTVGEGIGNMVETTPLLHALSRYGKVWVLAKPTTPGSQVILDNRNYVEEVIYIHSKRLIMFDAFDVVVQTYSGNSNKEPKFGEFKTVIWFNSEDTKWAKECGEAAGNLRQLRKVPWIIVGEELDRLPRSFVNCGESLGAYDVVLGSGAYDEAKVWPGFGKLKLQLEETGLNFLDLGGVEDNPPLQDVAATIREAGVYVGNDSGLAHIAAAVRTPSVILYGPTPVEKNLPYQSSFVWNVEPKSWESQCRPCKYQKATREECGFHCWNSIEVGRIRELVSYILKKYYNQRRVR